MLGCLIAAEARAQFIQMGAGPWDYNDTVRAGSLVVDNTTGSGVGTGTLTGPASGLITINLSDGGGFAAGNYTLFDFTSASASSFDVADFSLGTIPHGSIGDYDRRKTATRASRLQ